MPEYSGKKIYFGLKYKYIFREGKKLPEASLGTADFDGMYTGCDYDAETGLTYHWNRWRSEDGSAFISEDPIRDGMNWYGYAGQNPMVYMDRIGLFASSDYLGPGVEGPQPKTQNQENGFVPLVQNPSGMPPNQTPNITGPSNVQTSLPPVPDVKTDGRNLNEKIIETERKSKTVLDWIQTALDVLGVIPVFGDAVGKGGKAARFVAKNGDEIAGAAKRVFLSGLGKNGANIAEKWAKENGEETLEMYLKREGVDALIGPYVRDNSIWNTIEKPILNNYKDVTSINIINPLE